MVVGKTERHIIKRLEPAEGLLAKTYIKQREDWCKLSPMETWNRWGGCVDRPTISREMIGRATTDWPIAAEGRGLNRYDQYVYRISKLSGSAGLETTRYPKQRSIGNTS